jgi:hypothetical protein
MSGRLASNALGAVGAVIGGIAGYFAFTWLANHGWYGLMLPGALLGFGCGMLARHRSSLRGLACALGALGLALFAEWKEFPFAKDDSFFFMVSHFHEKSPPKILMLVAGMLLAFWLGKDGGYSGRVGAGKPAPRSGSAETGEP